MIASPYQSMFATEVLPDGTVVMRPERVSPGDSDKMKSTLRSFAREWSTLGESERKQSFTPIIDEIGDYFQG